MLIIETRTNSHAVVLNANGVPVGTICNPVKLPKGVLRGPASVELYTCTAIHDGVEVLLSARWGKAQVVCNKCNKVDSRYSR